MTQQFYSQALPKLNESTHPPKKLYKNIFNILTQNIEKLEITQMPISKKLDKQIQHIYIMESHLKIKRNELLTIYGNKIKHTSRCWGKEVRENGLESCLRELPGWCKCSAYYFWWLHVSLSKTHQSEYLMLLHYI